MTIDAVRRKSNRTSRREREHARELPIGETDANIFNCPACARPLAVGSGAARRARRGCSRACARRARRVHGDRRLAGVFLTGDIVVGIATLLSAADDCVAVQPDPIVTPSERSARHRGRPPQRRSRTPRPGRGACPR